MGSSGEKEVFILEKRYYMQNNTGQHWIIQAVKGLHLPNDQHAVFGSGLLDVLGLKHASDIDLIVTRPLFEGLSADGQWQQFIYPDKRPGLRHKTQNIEMFYHAGMPLCDTEGVERMVNSAVAIDGVKFVRLDDILAWKRAFGREKDLRDVKLIETYLKGLMT